MARAWVINSYSGYQGLSLVDVPVEQPGPGEIRLRVEAFALNWGDMEAAGIVEAVGEGVEGIAIGDRYCTLPYFYYQRGASTETLIIDAGYLTPAPDGLSAVESASICMQYMTAYFPLAEISKVGAGNHVLATAATSTAGTASLEIGRILGATMIGTTRFAANRDYLQTKGADHVVVTDGKGPSVAEQLLEMTGGKGIDAAFDPVGKTMIAQYSPALARNARIYFYGTLDTKPPVLPIKDMFQKNATALFTVQLC
jgi:NADPH2:quinone reductase